MLNLLNRISNNKDYNNEIKDIVEDKDFDKIKTIVHHGTSRLNHSLRVSYLSYSIAKKLKCDSKVAAEAGLLHDFFLEKEGNNIKGFKLIFTHPKIAKENAKVLFNVDDKVQNVIETHMFPFSLSVPASKEAWIVSTIDKVVAVSEFSSKFKTQLTLWALFIINFIK
ncbi:MAG TPA: HD domain-containing protein [Bacilli bacterium]|nr:HD domain-containing protein [Bacilli bacterium]